jgi:hypothetical protein
MRLDTVTAEIRPRSDWEAVDLGFAMVRRSFWRCLTAWWLALGIPTIIGALMFWDHPLILLVLFWWGKPAGSRMVLFEISRRLFGEEPSWKSVWREIPRAWWRRFFYRFLWARFSPWLPVTLAVEDLEGLRGKAYKQRSGQVVRRGEGVIMRIYFISDLASVWLGLGILMMVVMFLPEGQDGSWRQALESWDWNFSTEIPVLITRTVTACMIVAMSLIDVFMIGAGFGLYMNNRTWIEGWDVELAFKRLANRLGKMAVWMFFFFMIGVTGQAAETPADGIKRVKADDAFMVHTVIDKIPKKVTTTRTGIFSGELLEILMQVFLICGLVLLAALIGWMIWKCRHVFLMPGGRMKVDRFIPSARVVMGMDVSPHTLPADVPTAAWALWQRGSHQESLGLLYRGSISRVMELGRVEIQESDTEGDCVRRVERAGADVHPDYFRGITGLWIRLAYAGVVPADSEVQGLCERWPFGERRMV